MTRPTRTCPACRPRSTPARATVKYLNEHGMIDRRDFVDQATSVQHQIDHLNGKMFDHLSKVKRDMLIKKSKKLNG